MKNKSLILTRILLVVLIVPAIFMLYACGEHKHSFDETWQTSETEHWHECVFKNCKETKDRELHTWNDGEITVTPTETADGVKIYTCTVCNRIKTEPVEYVAPTLTQEEWDSAMDLTNVSFTRTVVRNYSGSESNETTEVSGNLIHFTDSYGSNCYYEKDGDLYYIYKKDSSNNWVKEDTEKKNYDYIRFCLSVFAGKRDNFQYDTTEKVYYCQEIKVKTAAGPTEIYSNPKFKFENGKLVSITTSSSSGTMNMTFKYKDVTITLPNT